MSSGDRRRYLTATVLDQDFLDHCMDNLENKLELVVDIETPTGFIRASDRPKYVDGVFYDNRLVFPVINRTVGEWLSPELEFSTQRIELNNSDGEFDEFIPGGANYDGFIGKTVKVRLGLRDVASTYTTIFNGTISDVGGFARTVRSIVITARDDYEALNVSFPNTTLNSTNFTSIESEVAGTILPVIYGDWTVSGNPKSDNASVPTFITNGQASRGTPAINVEVYISENVNFSFDQTAVYLKRDEKFILISSSDILSIVDNRKFEIDQDSGNTTLFFEGSTINFVLEDGDEFFVKVKGKNIGATLQDNIVAQAEDILLTYGGLVAGDFDTNWGTFQLKLTPAASAIFNIKSRVWIQEPQSVIQFALSLLEQVRLEAFVDRNLKLKLTGQHLDEFVASPTFRVSNRDVIEGQFQPQQDVRNHFNRAQGVFNFLPDINENSLKTSIFRNTAAVTQMSKEIAKEITFPNLYVETDVDNQIKEILKISSSGYEHIVCELTWRALLLDIGDFIKLDVKIGSTVFSDVPCSIREIGYDPTGIKIPVRLWSYQLVPFTGYAGVTGAVGGTSATIIEET